MLEQEKELTAVSRVLEETWERLVTVVQMYKEQFRVQKEVGVGPVPNSQGTSVGWSVS
jgi:hypothetical protein